MKKSVITLIAILALSTSTYDLNAQFDGYANVNDCNEENGIFGQNKNDGLPFIPFHDYATEEDAPLGSGLLILGAMGIGYCIRKRQMDRQAK